MFINMENIVTHVMKRKSLAFSLEYIGREWVFLNRRRMASTKRKQFDGFDSGRRNPPRTNENNQINNFDNNQLDDMTSGRQHKSVESFAGREQRKLQLNFNHGIFAIFRSIDTVEHSLREAWKI